MSKGEGTYHYHYQHFHCAACLAAACLAAAVILVRLTATVRSSSSARNNSFVPLECRHPSGTRFSAEPETDGGSTSTGMDDGVENKSVSPSSLCRT